MKPLLRILSIIRSLPEGAKKFIAGVFLFAVAIILFNGWALSLSSRLDALSQTETKSSLFLPESKDYFQSGEVSSPARGIAESFKSLERFVLPSDYAVSRGSGGAAGMITNVADGINEQIDKGLAYVGAGLARAWHYVYDPFR